ncbi:hypothetical protein JG687_00019060, partial [Phytophthora cactorum]
PIAATKSSVANLQDSSEATEGKRTQGSSANFTMKPFVLLLMFVLAIAAAATPGVRGLQ